MSQKVISRSKYQVKALNTTNMSTLISFDTTTLSDCEKLRCNDISNSLASSQPGTGEQSNKNEPLIIILKHLATMG